MLLLAVAAWETHTREQPLTPGGNLRLLVSASVNHVQWHGASTMTSQSTVPSRGVELGGACIGPTCSIRFATMKVCQCSIYLRTRRPRRLPQSKYFEAE